MMSLLLKWIGTHGHRGGGEGGSPWLEPLFLHPLTTLFYTPYVVTPPLWKLEPGSRVDATHAHTWPSPSSSPQYIYIYKSQMLKTLKCNHGKTAGLIWMKVVPYESPGHVLCHKYWVMLIRPTPPAPRTKRGRPCASLSPWGPPTGLYGVSADSLGLPDAEYFIGWDLASLPPAPEIKRGRPCASLRPTGS